MPTVDNGREKINQFMGEKVLAFGTLRQFTGYNIQIYTDTLKEN